MVGLKVDFESVGEWTSCGEKIKTAAVPGFLVPPEGPFTPQLSVSKMVIFVKNRAKTPVDPVVFNG